jgi:hypothetical protein
VVEEFVEDAMVRGACDQVGATKMETRELAIADVTSETKAFAPVNMIKEKGVKIHCRGMPSPLLEKEGYPQ